MHPIRQVFSRGTWWAGVALILVGCGDRSNKRVYFGNLEDGSNVESPFRVEMKAENLIVEPAALGVNEGHGHFHILIDAPMAPTKAPIPADEKHLHFGQGQTETLLDLPVGQHTLVLQFATGDHVPYDPQVFQQIQVNVTKQNPKPAVDTTAIADSADRVDTLNAAETTGMAPVDTAKPAETSPKPSAKP